MLCTQRVVAAMIITTNALHTVCGCCHQHLALQHAHEPTAVMQQMCAAVSMTMLSWRKLCSLARLRFLDPWITVCCSYCWCLLILKRGVPHVLLVHVCFGLNSNKKLLLHCVFCYVRQPLLHANFSFHNFRCKVAIAIQCPTLLSLNCLVMHVAATYNGAAEACVVLLFAALPVVLHGCRSGDAKWAWDKMGESTCSHWLCICRGLTQGAAWVFWQ